MVKDHLGNKFKTKKEMCEYWGTNYTTYQNRQAKGWSLRESLIGRERPRERFVTDHVGNKFKSNEDMCKHWNVDYETYKYRRLCHWSKEEALSGNVDYKVFDHKGNGFRSMTEMFDFYGIEKWVYQERKKKGLPLEICLDPTYIVNEKKQIYDHLGNSFKTANEMCKHWDVNYSTYGERIRAGWTIEEALANKKSTETSVYDHLGNKFDNTRRMIEYHGVTEGTYYTRKSQNLSLEECLSGCQPRIQDPVGNAFKTIVDMCHHYGITTKHYEYCMASGYSLEETLGLIPSFHTRTNDVVVDKHLTVIKHIDNGWYSCVKDGFDDIMTHDEIVDYYRKNILKTAI